MEPIIFQFQKPVHREGLSEPANAAIALAALVGQLSTEERTGVFTRDDRPENVSEHSHMVSFLAAELAAQFFPDIDHDHAARLGNVHDILEAYVKDTPTHRISEVGKEQKRLREHAAFQRIKQDYSDLPGFVTLVEEYEAQITNTARFVRMIDKLGPLLIHINDSLAGLRHYAWDSTEIRANARTNAENFLRTYPEKARIIGIRNELAQFVADGLDNDPLFGIQMRHGIELAQERLF